MTELTVSALPLLSVRAFVTTFGGALGDLASAPELLALRAIDAAAPLTSSDELRSAIRDVLRFGGFKPTGRSKPASEYLLKAAREGTLASINLAVDACNAVSLHSGLPISVVDCDRLSGALSIRIAPTGSSYVFNASGQVIDVSGLVCLHDDGGPCANAVKDSQRAKTDSSTRKTLSIIWGAAAFASHVDAATAWYRSLLEQHGATTEDVRVISAETASR